MAISCGLQQISACRGELLLFLFISHGFAFFLRHLEKLSDLFEKLRVSRTSKTNKLRHLCKYLSRFPDYHCYVSSFVSLQKVEGRVASDEELKLTELLRYYMRDIQAAKVRHVYLFLQDAQIHSYVVKVVFMKFHYCCISNTLCIPVWPDRTILIEITNNLQYTTDQGSVLIIIVLLQVNLNEDLGIKFVTLTSLQPARTFCTGELGH